MSIEQPALSPAQPPMSHKFGGLAWTAMILGIVGVIGSPLLLWNNLTVIAAAVGVVLGVIALFGTRKVLAGSGITLCVAGITFTLIAQSSIDVGRDFGDSEAAMRDVSIASCSIVENEYSSQPSVEPVVNVVNSTDKTQTYLITIGVSDAAGARVGTVHANVSALAPGQAATLSGMNASGFANEGAQAGPATCTVASVDRFPS